MNKIRGKLNELELMQLLFAIYAAGTGTQFSPDLNIITLITLLYARRVSSIPIINHRIKQKKKCCPEIGRNIVCTRRMISYTSSFSFYSFTRKAFFFFFFYIILFAFATTNNVSTSAKFCSTILSTTHRQPHTETHILYIYM